MISLMTVLSFVPCNIVHVPTTVTATNATNQITGDNIKVNYVRTLTLVVSTLTDPADGRDLLARNCPGGARQC